MVRLKDIAEVCGVDLPDNVKIVLQTGGAKEWQNEVVKADKIGRYEVVDGDMVYRKYLKPGEAPETVFPVKYRSGLILREYCNLHGLWAFKIP